MTFPAYEFDPSLEQLESVRGPDDRSSYEERSIYRALSIHYLGIRALSAILLSAAVLVAVSFIDGSAPLVGESPLFAATVGALSILLAVYTAPPPLMRLVAPARALQFTDAAALALLAIAVFSPLMGLGGNALYLGSSFIVVLAALAIEQTLIDRLRSPVQRAIGIGADEPRPEYSFERLARIALLALAVAAAAGWAWYGKLSVFGLFAIAAAVLLADTIRGVFEACFLGEHALAARFRRLGIRTSEGIEFIDVVRNLKSLVLDYRAERPLGEALVREVELIDQRIESGALLESLKVLLAQARDERLKSAYAYLASRSGVASMLRAENVREYPGMGIAGEVQGIRFSVGDEDFLIERGVILGTSELERSYDDGSFILVAVNDGVVGRIELAPLLLMDGTSLVQTASRLKIRPHLFSLDAVTALDDIGRRIGLELPLIEHGLDAAAYERRIESMRPVCVYTNGDIHPGIQRADVILQVDSGESMPGSRVLAIPSRDLRVAGEILSRMHQLSRFSKVATTLGVALAIVLVAGAALLFLPPLIVLMSRSLFRIGVLGWLRYRIV